MRKIVHFCYYSCTEQHDLRFALRLYFVNIRACVANEILKRAGSVRSGAGGGGGSPRNCRWGCDVWFFKS